MRYLTTTRPPWVGLLLSTALASSRTILGALAAMAWLAFVPHSAEATPPPDMPLPECVYVAGQPVGGPCPALSLRVSGNAVGRLGAGSTVLVNTVPAVPVCDYWYAYTNEWRPSGCYAEVGAPSVVTCGFIDLRNEAHEWREMPCAQALYKSTTGLPNLFTFRRPEGSEDPFNNSIICGATPAYHTYIYGGAGNNENHVWRTRGPAALKCGITFNGPRPDGMRGPTWAKVRVRVNYAETPDIANGSSTHSEFYVPIDGDMRDIADIDVTGVANLTEVDWDQGKLIATYRTTLTNLGDLAAEDVNLVMTFPKVMMVTNVSGAECTMPGNIAGSPNPAAMIPVGGNVTCDWDSIAAQGTAQVEVTARIVDATDLDALQNGEGATLEKFRGEPEGVELRVRATNDNDADNNRFITKLSIPFRAGTFADTRAAMEVLAPYFDYQTDKLNLQCNLYEDDISERLEAIHRDHPEVFQNLAYGGVTSGQYKILGLDTDWTRAGHVGVVVYLKGTNYRQTGIVINGTPMISPLNAVSEAGPDGETSLTSTATNGLYLRTPADKYPGKVQPETKGGKGFEGWYEHNQPEFTHGGGPAEPVPADAPMTCPLPPEAVMITTRSPVEIIATNSAGKRVVTENGFVVAQELGTGIHSMAFPHEDGTFGWSLLLPKDDYDIEVVGTRTGAYTLILTTFDEDGNPVEALTEGFTNPGQTDEYAIEAPEPPVTPPVTPPTNPDPPGGSNNGGSIPESRGGGGAVDPGILLGLLLMLGLLRVRAGARRR